MKSFNKKILTFCIPLAIYILLSVLFMPYLLSLANGPSTKQQIDQSFKNAIEKNYELLILGNSRTYRGINPDKLSYDAYNFSHDNDSYNQIFYKLKYLMDHEKNIHHLILSLDYFQFSFKSETRNYAYADYFDKDYANDFKGSGIQIIKWKYILSNADPRKLLSLIPISDKPYLKENGQYIKPGLAKDSDFTKRDIHRLDFQVNYFEKTLSLCKENNIKVYMITLPTRQNELKSYTQEEIKDFENFVDRYVDNHEVFYLNYSKLDGFTTEDFTDITHLNEKSADRFTEILDKSLLVFN